MDNYEGRRVRTITPSSSIVMYCENPENYSNYSDILEDIRDLCNYIPNTIFIPKISDVNVENRHFYLHTAAYIIEYTKLQCKGRELVVNALGNNVLKSDIMALNKADNVGRLKRLAYGDGNAEKLQEIQDYGGFTAMSCNILSRTDARRTQG